MIRSLVLGNEANENRKRYNFLKLKYSQCSQKYENNTAKSIADRVDLGMILLGVTTEDLAKLEPITKNGQFAVPNIKLSIYKNRRGSYKGVYLWCNADLGTCRIQPMFCTDYRYALTPIENVSIQVDPPWERNK